MTSVLRQAYFAAPVWLQNLVLSAYGMRLRRLRYGRGHRRMLAQLLESERYSLDQLRELQLRELNRVLRHAREHVPFYRNRGLPRVGLSQIEDIAEIRLTTKDELRVSNRLLVASPYARRRISSIHTGGTTGTPLTVYCDRETLQRNYAFFARFLRGAGVPAGARTAVFAGRTVVSSTQRRPPFWRHNAASNAVLFSSYHLSPATVPHYVDALVRYRPALIDSYPSSIEPIARYAVRHGIDGIRPVAVVTSSETLSDGARDVITNAFGCKVFDYYGSAEMAALVTQCAHGSYHINPEFGIVEVLRDGRPARPGETGEIVATGFINPVMPLIRYATGDLAVQTERDCACGLRFPVIERILGRMDDVIITPEGRRIGRLDPIFKVVAGLDETRIVQDARDHVRVEVMLSPGTGVDDVRASLAGELKARLGDSMRIDIVPVPVIAREGSGKLRTVVNELVRRGEISSM